MNKLLGVTQFLNDYPGMRIIPSRNKDLILRGNFSFLANNENHPQIAECYELEFLIPEEFPHDLPKITELQDRIPRDGQHHINHDGTLCLGSPLRMFEKIQKNPTLTGFVESCLIPYLYAVTNKLLNNSNFIFGELSHGRNGIIEDYSNLFGLTTDKQIIYALKLISLKKRIANKKPCPCQCKGKLSYCGLRNKINKFRKMLPRSWFKKHAVHIESGKRFQ